MRQPRRVPRFQCLHLDSNANQNNNTATADDLVTLDWNDNKETNLVSYIVYRTTTSGGPYELRAWGLTASYYSDPSVVSGTTYYYVVTVINESSMESEYSNEAAASPVGGA